MATLAAQLNESAGAFRAVFENANLRRIQLALAASTIGVWTYATALAVYAFETHGAGGVALVWIIRTIPGAVASPFCGALADRYPKKYVMLVSDLLRVVLMIVAAIMVWNEVDAAVVFALTGVISLVGIAFDPAEASLLPRLATTPTELTAANVSASTINSVGFFVGPALGGALLAATDPQVVFVFTAGLTFVSAFFVSRIHPPEEDAESGQAAEESPAQATERLFAGLPAGFKTIAGDQRLLIIIALFAATSIVLGTTEVLVVSIAFDFLHLATSGVGYLNAAFGVGALLGAVVAAGFVGMRRLSVPFVGGAFLIGAPLALIAASPSVALAVTCLGAVGIGNTLLDVAGFTLLQRAVPENVLARVWGVLNMTLAAAFGIGAAITPLLLNGLTIEATIVVTGLFVPLLVIVFGPRLIRIDAAATAPAADRLALLQGSTIFAPLPVATLERLATQLIPVTAAAGDVLMREGEPGDRFYLVAGGRLKVSAHGRDVATLGPGDPVGEIALLRDVPRTATVMAEIDSELYALTREDFLGAVTSHAESKAAAETAVATRLAGLQGVTGRMPIPRV